MFEKKGEGYLSEEICCCGINELSGLEDHGHTPEKLVAHYLEEACVKTQYNYGKPPDVTVDFGLFSQRARPFLFFSTGDKKLGDNMASFIRKKRLGRLSASKPRYNPTGSPTLRMWMWEPNQENILKWYKKWRGM